MLPDSKETGLGSSGQEASPLSGKCSFSAMFVHGSASPTAISGVVDVSEVPGCHFSTDALSVRVTKITLMIGVS